LRGNRKNSDRFGRGMLTGQHPLPMAASRS
jgi:hypothetical protein